MATLAQEKCTACHKNAPRATEAEIAQLKPQIPDWKIVELDGVPRLERTYKFPDFKTALALTNRVGELAEAERHHPALLTEWGKVTASWWTDAIHVPHRNDSIVAAKTDEIAGQFPQKIHKRSERVDFGCRRVRRKKAGGISAGTPNPPIPQSRPPLFLIPPDDK
ncbi:MAG: 4a-hydroxytetrahydrobiopterin dehydratase [Oscillatoria princeps RMCB-10]|nr:4a-hydroxytetrahydrobiopterin dehydratase [Oscillatoria princeps RMCB-10]